MDIGKRVLGSLIKAAAPAYFLLDVMPWCNSYHSLAGCGGISCWLIVKYWPSWLWGGGFKKMAFELRKDINDFKDIPYKIALVLNLRPACSKLLTFSDRQIQRKRALLRHGCIGNLSRS